MVSIVPLQRRTEASASAAAAAAAARSIFSLERRRRDEEGSAVAGMDLSGTQGELAIPMHANTVVSPYGAGAGAGGHVLPLHHHHEQQHGTNTNTNTNNGQSPAAAQPPPSPPPAVIAEEMGISAKKRGGIPAAGGIGGGGVRYRECLKNHAAAIGGSATDGCGEFMPSGEDGSLEALKCSACGCHRNFHRKDLDDGAAGDADADDVMYTTTAVGHGHGHHRAARRLLAPAMPHPHRGNTAGGGGLLVPAGDPYAAYATAARALPPPPGHGHLHGHHGHQYVMPLSMVHNSESDEMDGGGAGAGGGGSSSSSRKRFRTKFTAEQKARMLEFAERVGWRLQKLDEAMVNGFCQEIGVKRRVLKVWMHNNKHNLATTIKRLDAPPEASPQMPAALQMMPPAGVMPAPAAMQQGAGPSCHRGDPASPPPSVLKLE